jgi:hypothetical protein
MAYSLRLTGIGTDGTELLRIEPHWWEISKLGEKVRIDWVTTNETGSFTDDDAEISVDEGRILHKLFRPALMEKIAYNKKCIESNEPKSHELASVALAMYETYGLELESMLQTLDLAVGADACKFAHFHLCVFAWESGL